MCWEDPRPHSRKDFPSDAKGVIMWELEQLLYRGLCPRSTDYVCIKVYLTMYTSQKVLSYQGDLWINSGYPLS